MKTVTDKKKIQEVFDRGIVSEIIPSKKELLDFLASGGRLKIYIGADPTFTSLHLGHAGNYMFLEDLRKLGHEVIMLIGDFTALIGDPSGRLDARPALTEEQIKTNMKDWMVQVRPLLNFDDKENPAKLLYNSTWLGKLDFKDVIKLASHFTVQQMLKRDMFEKRTHEDAPIHLNEFLYPLMQGYDSVAMDVNAELCGTDQLFNALAGRTLLKKLKSKDKFVITLNLLQNPKTGEMMSKSKGTGVFLSAEPNDMYGALMAQPDEMTDVFFVHCTRIPLSEKKKILAAGPKEAKMCVAFEIVKMIHGEKAAVGASESFDKLFSKKDVTGVKLPEVKVSDEINPVDLVISCFKEIGIEKSKTEARRLVLEGALRIDGGEILKDPKISFKPQTEVIEVVKIGRFRFRLIPEWSR
jgi:tyrosyl-tRNA synthetase